MNRWKLKEMGGSFESTFPDQQTMLRFWGSLMMVWNYEAFHYSEECQSRGWQKIPYPDSVIMALPASAAMVAARRFFDRARHQGVFGGTKKG